MVESQAANGLELRAENFESVTAACILTPESAIRPRRAWYGDVLTNFPVRIEPR